MGIDLTSVAGATDAVAAHDERYLVRVYTARERAGCGGAGRLRGVAHARG